MHRLLILLASVYFAVNAAAQTTASLTGPKPTDTGPVNWDEEDPTGGLTGTEAGASGHDTGAFTLSKGGLIAIVIVVSLVVGLGGISLALWYIAKKRQWEVRKSLKRASRRLTGRLGDSRAKRQSRRGGVRMASPPASKKRSPLSKETDVEKGEGTKAKPNEHKRPSGTTTTITSSFDVDTPRAKTWKEKLFGSK